MTSPARSRAEIDTDATRDNLVQAVLMLLAEERHGRHTDGGARQHRIRLACNGVDNASRNHAFQLKLVAEVFGDG